MLSRKLHIIRYQTAATIQYEMFKGICLICRSKNGQSTSAVVRFFIFSCVFASCPLANLIITSTGSGGCRIDSTFFWNVGVSIWWRRGGLSEYHRLICQRVKTSKLNAKTKLVFWYTRTNQTINFMMNARWLTPSEINESVWENNMPYLQKIFTWYSFTAYSMSFDLKIKIGNLIRIGIKCTRSK